MSACRLLRIALVVFGVLMLLVYPIALVWPSGWIWHLTAVLAALMTSADVRREVASHDRAQR